MKKLIKYFLQGLLYTVPISVTVYVLVFVFLWLDGLLRDLEFFHEGRLADFNFPGLGLILILAFVTFVGFIGRRLVTTPLSNSFNTMLDRAPLIKVIYSSVKDLMSAFVGKERKFDTPVMVQLDSAGVLHRFGFITASDLSDLGVNDMVGVYLPSSYGVLGEFFVVPADHVKPVDANSAEFMKFIVSGGVAKIK